MVPPIKPVTLDRGYRLFGKRETCWMAPPEYRDRLL
jgi:hypothetical protein